MQHLPFKNYMEDAVAYMLNRLAPQYPEICMCDRCRTDMMMIALTTFRRAMSPPIRAMSCGALRAWNSSMRWRC